METIKIYCFIFLGSIGLFDFGLTRPTGAKANFELVIISICSVVYVAENVLHVTKSKDRDVDAVKVDRARQHGIPFDLRTKLQVTMDFREMGIVPYPEHRVFMFS